MIFVILKSTVTPEGALIFHALTSITQKASGIVDDWIELSKAKTNCIDPEKCDLISFTDKDKLEEDLELWGIAAENVAIIGVEPG